MTRTLVILFAALLLAGAAALALAFVAAGILSQVEADSYE